MDGLIRVLSEDADDREDTVATKRLYRVPVFFETHASDADDARELTHEALSNVQNWNDFLDVMIDEFPQGIVFLNVLVGNIEEIEDLGEADDGEVTNPFAEPRAE